MDDQEALTHVTLFALEHDDFREAWDAAVRTAADACTAQIVGARMGGLLEGKAAYWSEVPTPAHLDEDDVTRAFRRAVRAETARRLNAMFPGEVDDLWSNEDAG